MDVDINKDNYQQVVVESGTPTLVDFWGPQCSRCFALMPAVEKLAEEKKGQLRLIKIDASKNRKNVWCSGFITSAIRMDRVFLIASSCLLRW